MKNRLVIGDKRSFVHKIGTDDIATFDTGKVHPVCSTFALAKYIEWTSRIFVIEIKDETEEGIGSFLQIDHVSPAFIDQELLIEAEIISIVKNELTCAITVYVSDRVIAKAQTGQKLLKKDRINEIFSSLGNKD